MANWPRDFQRRAVYDWEESLPEWSGQSRLVLPECVALIAQVWDDRTCGARPMPRISEGRRGSQRASGSRRRIVLPRGARRTLFVLHETAHAVVDWMMGRKLVAHHGPEFVLVYLRMLGEFGGVNTWRALEMAWKQGVQVGAWPTRKVVDYAGCMPVL